MDIDTILQNGESSTVEFKTNTPPPQVLARIVSAFANTEGGVILLGIREPDIILGVDPHKFEKTYQQTIRHVTGHSKTSSEVVDYKNKKIGVISVEKSVAPIGSSEGYFRRVGSQDHALGAEQLKHLFSEELGVNSAVESLSETVSKQTDEIGKLRESFEKVNSLKRKVYYGFLGALASGAAKYLLSAFGVEIG